MTNDRKNEKKKIKVENEPRGGREGMKAEKRNEYDKPLTLTSLP